ncbi:MAG: DDE-type integrase/transposase/recombinase [Lachnospiraceae bacterium]|nr:DDE-type integrase/transposase/recombinase [Lachnospiraceae bacterium]
METKETSSWQDDTALERFKLISPLLDESLDEAKLIALRKEISSQNEISVRSLRRYESYYRESGFSGLRPKNRAQRRSQKLPDNFDELVAEAIQLKREVPERSVSQIIYILELEGRVEPGRLKRSTMQRHLYKAGFGERQMQMYKDARKSSSKRFCKPNRMMLVQADIKYGPKLPIGKKGAMVQTYLSSVMDDHSRYILQAQFYDNQEETIVEDTFRKAILKHGKFDSGYCDHGSQYISKQLKLSLSKLGINVKYAPVRNGAAKGKIEKYHQIVDGFTAEAKAHKIRTLEELNRYWEIYLEEYYHNKPHDGIREYYESTGNPVPEKGISPQQEWNRDTRPLTFLDASVVAEAFLHHEQRLVDKGACISFKGKKYETKPSLIGCKVEISYDPASPETITVSYAGMEPFTAEPVKIGSYCSRKPAIPASMQETEVESSRFLTALEKKHEKSREHYANAISFGAYRKDGDGHV